MLQFLLGALVGSIATASCMQRSALRTPSAARLPLGGSGRVDELSSAAHQEPPRTALNAGDGTPDAQQPRPQRVATPTGDDVPPSVMRH